MSREDKTVSINLSKIIPAQYLAHKISNCCKGNGRKEKCHFGSPGSNHCFNAFVRNTDSWETADEVKVTGTFKVTPETVRLIDMLLGPYGAVIYTVWLIQEKEKYNEQKTNARLQEP